ncbi:MAG: GTPase Era [Actinomycetes bacterium]|jgi:GTP-binding protein Era|nr:GTPase Era [Actinomycetes bacterium]
MTDFIEHSGFISLVGRPNAGKSTLTNALVGAKVAITSDTAQTTRHRLRAVLNTPDAQLIFVDTPGLHKAHDALGEEVNRSTFKALEDTDVLALLIDASQPVGSGDKWIAGLLQQMGQHVPTILVLTKTDLVDSEALAQQRALAARLGDFTRIIELSAKTGQNLTDFVAAATALLPAGPRWFPADMQTDQPIEVMVAEFIREKALRSTFDEVPHAVGVAVEELTQDADHNLTRIQAVLYVERESQKGIIVGKGGGTIKAIGSAARLDLEQLFGTRVYLDLRVKVRKNWRRDAAQIRRFGYGEAG